VGNVEIKNELQTHSPKLVTEVESLISELSRITLLWEEQFVVVLREVRLPLLVQKGLLLMTFLAFKSTQLQSDLGPRLRTLRDEIKRIVDNSSLPAADKVCHQ